MRKLGLLAIMIAVFISCANEKTNKIDQFLDRMDFLINQYDKELDKSVLDEAKLTEIVKEIEVADTKAEKEFGHSASDAQVKRYEELIKRLDKVIDKEEKILKIEYEKE